MGTPACRVGTLADACLHSFTGLVKDAQHPRNENDYKDRAESDTSTPAGSPTAVTVIATATAEQKDQKNDDYQHDDLTSGVLEFLALLDHLIAGLAG